LRLASGQELRAPGSHTGGATRGMLFIRPERVEISPGTAGAGAGDPSANLLYGKVRRCSFLGNILRYSVELDGAPPITVDLQNAAGVLPLSVGAAVRLRWPVADSLIIPG
jgi:hypothetical protein